ILIVVSFGTAGYMLIEHWSFLDALYMTVITMASVGFKEVHDLSDQGVVFTIVLIVVGVSTFAYAMSAAARVILEGEFQQVFGRSRLEKRLLELRNHFIICGFGRMGRIITRELKADGIPFVAIEKNAATVTGDDSTLIIEGDATQDDLLRKVGIERARGLISVLPTDAENLYVVLSARELNPNLFIVARAGEEGSEKKLLRAGANKVVSPYHIGGLRIAHTVLRPAVVDFIEFATRSGNLELQMEEVTIPEGSRLSGLSLDQCGFGRELGVIIVAIKRASGEMKFNPTFRSTVKTGDTLIALGETPKLRQLEQLMGMNK
ncbi:MAG TPA: potassium channel protein, partial [Dissulfurispiraceae bacterium]|nr:potassium channel protein [Dissulfurispiraceae bacterium]